LEDLVSRRGRKPRLSSAAIIEAASQMVAKGGIRDFSMPKLAKALSVGVMSLYTYFPSRDDLLNALSEDVFSRFEMPDFSLDWKGNIHAWLWAMVRHFDQNPEALALIKWNDHVSTGWLRRWFPIAVLLKQQGLKGPALAFAMSWFTNISFGFISSQLSSPERRRAEALAHIDQLDADGRRLATELWLDFCDLDRDELLEFGFRKIVEDLADLADENYPLKPRLANAASLARIVEQRSSGESAHKDEDDDDA
jgi:AcrR family transcriptional regulator